MEKYKMTTFKPNERLKLVETEEEFWETHEFYLKKLKQLKYDLKLFIYHPDEYLKKFEKILTDMVTTGVMSLEQANEHRTHLYTSLNNPKPFQKWFEKNKDKLKEKFSKKVK